MHPAACRSTLHQQPQTQTAAETAVSLNGPSEFRQKGNGRLGAVPIAAVHKSPDKMSDRTPGVTELFCEHR